MVDLCFKITHLFGVWMPGCFTEQRCGKRWDNKVKKKKKAKWRGRRGEQIRWKGPWEGCANLFFLAAFHKVRLFLCEQGQIISQWVEQRQFSLTVRLRSGVFWDRPLCMLIITKATKIKGNRSSRESNFALPYNKTGIKMYHHRTSAKD